MSRGLTSAQLQRGHAYRCVHGNPFVLGAMIKIESIGPRYVRYRLDRMRVDHTPHWGAVRSHPRVLFNSWDGSWIEAEDPTA